VDRDLPAGRPDGRVRARREDRPLTRRVLQILALAATAVVLWSVIAESPRASQPFPDAHEYADAANQIAHGRGYVTYIYSGQPQPPRYPPGFSLALSPFETIGHNVQHGAAFYALFYVLVTVAAAWALGGPGAALLVAILVGVSPFARYSATVVMADAATAGLTAAMLIALRRPTEPGARLGGAMGGILVAMRLTSVAALGALFVALPRRFLKSAVLLALPALIGLALFQWATFGSPTDTGYSYWGVAGGTMSASHITEAHPRGDGPFVIADKLDGKLLRWTCPCPYGGPQAGMSNIVFYPLVILGLFWIFAPPLLTLPGLVYAWRRRREPIGRFALSLLVLSLVPFVLYFYQGARFMAAPATVLLVLSGVALSDWITRLVARFAPRLVPA
jgi:hypothetical protein